MDIAARNAQHVISLKVTLRGIRPPIWRRLEVPSQISLGLLHAAIQATMGWGGFHLYAFEIFGRRYGDPTTVDDVADDMRLTLAGVIKSGVRRFFYTYDFGDDWERHFNSETQQRGIREMVERYTLPCRACLSFWVGQIATILAWDTTSHGGYYARKPSPSGL